jgi:hypothetical protein
MRMRTALFVVSGLLIWGVCVVLARLLSASSQAMSLALGLFAAGWLGVAGINMILGVAWAGYSFHDELPIFLLIFVVPVAVAAIVKWIWFSGPR